MRRQRLVWTGLVAVTMLLMTSLSAVAAPVDISFRGAESAGRNGSFVNVRVPRPSAPGDTLLMFVTANRADRSINTPAGWERLDRQVDESMQTVLFTRVDNGSTGVRVTSTGSAKLDAQVLSYRGTSGVEDVATASESTNRRAHTAPTITGVSSGSWTIEYWADKSSATTSWATRGTKKREQSVGTLGGRITSVAADSNGSVSGTVGGHTATASSANPKAVMFTVVLGQGDGPGPVTTTRWVMNESTSGRVMHAARNDGPDGHIGGDVRPGQSVQGATAYQFPYLLPNAPPARPEHLVTVPDTLRLDPESENYRITFRVRTNKNFGNVLQKGQSQTTGGYWKFQMPNGIMACLFRGADGTTRTANSVQPINDNRWHVISCERSARAVTMTVDGIVTNVRTGWTGPIDNDKDLAVGGKLYCNQATVTCDYFTGQIDWIEISKG